MTQHIRLPGSQDLQVRVTQNPQIVLIDRLTGTQRRQLSSGLVSCALHCNSHSSRGKGIFLTINTTRVWREVWPPRTACTYSFDPIGRQRKQSRSKILLLSGQRGYVVAELGKLILESNFCLLCSLRRQSLALKLTRKVFRATLSIGGYR
jgi:hypothetical protein